jgi:hypothetical protein
LYTLGAFDLLKNKGLDETTPVVVCLILKLFLGLVKSGGQGTGQKLKFLSLTKPQHNFCAKTRSCSIIKIWSCAVLSSTHLLAEQTHPLGILTINLGSCPFKALTTDSLNSNIIHLVKDEISHSSLKGFSITFVAF